MFVHDMITLYEQIEKSDMIKGSKKENGKVKRYTIRLTEQEHQDFQEVAKKHNKNISELLIYLVEKEKNKK